MQATLDATGLKHLTKILTCASKFGDDLTLMASPDFFLLSATNSSMSAYCRFRIEKQFFARYQVEGDPMRPLDYEDDVRFTGQLLVKSLLSILKHRTVEKSVDRCELSIVGGATPGAHPAERDPDDQNQPEDEDSLESKLIVRLHCKHGVTKTHKLLLLNPTILTQPQAPEDFVESRLSVTPRAVRDMLEHFPLSRGPKSDPQLVWKFTEDEVYMKGLDSSLDTTVKGLSTEATISAAEFEMYDINEPPVTIAFHMREFLATVAFAESCTLSLDLRFTDPAHPLFIDVPGDLTDTLFVIATSQVVGARMTPFAQAPAQPRGVKREREREGTEDGRSERSASVSVGGGPASARKVKPIKAAVRVDRASVVRDPLGGSRAGSVRGSMPPPSSVPSWRATPAPAAMPPPPPPQPRPPIAPEPAPEPEPENENEPLFLPGSQLVLSQPLSQAAEAAIRESGLGIENMSAAEFLDMLEGEGEEVNIVPASQAQDIEMDMSMPLDEVPNASAHGLVYGGGGVVDDSDFDIYDGEDGSTQLGPTQEDITRSNSSSKAFRPLFDD